MSVTLHIYMIMILGTLVQNVNIFRCFFHFFKILIVQVGRKVKGQEVAQDDKKALSVVPYISGTIHHMIMIFGTQL